MVHYSVIIPECDCAEGLATQLSPLRAELDRLGQPYEVVCIDEGSSPATLAALSHLEHSEQHFRVVRLNDACGTSQALAAGIAAAKGDVLIAIEPGNRYLAEQIPELIAALARLDFVAGRLRLGPWRKLCHRVGRIPRWLLLGIEVRHPDCLFWAARREAVAGIELRRGMRRYLPWLVASRGFRVGDVYIDHGGRHAALHDPPANPIDLFTAWRACRRTNEPPQEAHRAA